MSSTSAEPTTPRSPDDPADAAEMSNPAVAAAVVPTTFSEYLRTLYKRIRGGESGLLPVLAGMVVLIILFQVKDSKFLTAGNITTLFTQAAAFILFGIAEVFVLLLGEIDLSIGFVGVVGATATVAASTEHGWSWPLAIIAGLVVTTLVGALQGLIFTVLRIPSFIVTLGGLLFFQGALIYLTNREGGPSSGGTIPITNNVLIDIVNGNMSPALGWIVMILAVLAYAALQLFRDRSRRAAGLVTPPLGLTLIKVGGAAVAGIVLVLICNVNRGSVFAVLHGVPWIVPIILVFVAIWTFVLDRTRFGRKIYAIGGNAEAARRAGINLTRMRVAAFALAGLSSGAAGIVYASRLQSISDGVDGGQLVLFAVAAAVIGGTSLFGGRGRVTHALIGGLVIATIDNGMALLGLSAETQDMVTALVLLAAVAVDALARRGQART